MNQDVPQPATATRSPGIGSTPARSAASPAARSQQSGWDAISASMLPVPATVLLSPLTLRTSTLSVPS